MKNKRLIRVITLLLTTVALVAGQNVWATTKTVTYTITNSIQIGNGNTDYRVTITRSGDAPFDNSGQWRLPAFLCLTPTTTTTSSVPTTALLAL